MKIEYLVYYKQKDEKVTKTDAYPITKEVYGTLLDSIVNTGKACNVEVETVKLLGNVETSIKATFLGEHIRKIEQIVHPNGLENEVETPVEYVKVEKPQPIAPQQVEQPQNNEQVINHKW